MFVKSGILYLLFIGLLTGLIISIYSIYRSLEPYVIDIENLLSDQYIVEDNISNIKQNGWLLRVDSSKNRFLYPAILYEINF
jgi:hypothetical protein